MAEKRKNRYRNRLDVRRGQNSKPSRTYGDKSHRYGMHEELATPDEIEDLARQYRREHDGV